MCLSSLNMAVWYVVFSSLHHPWLKNCHLVFLMPRSNRRLSRSFGLIHPEPSAAVWCLTLCLRSSRTGWEMGPSSLVQRCFCIKDDYRSGIRTSIMRKSFGTNSSQCLLCWEEQKFREEREPSWAHPRSKGRASNKTKFLDVTCNVLYETFMSPWQKRTWQVGKKKTNLRKWKLGEWKHLCLNLVWGKQERRQTDREIKKLHIGTRHDLIPK